MTRGYVCETVGRVVVDVAFLPSDAGLSWYGLKILNAIEENRLSLWIETQKAESVASDTAGFDLSWVKRTKDNRDWERSCIAEYGYIFNQKTKKLHVYHYGKLMCTVDTGCQSEREKYRYYFEHCYEIGAMLAYDRQKMSYDYGRPICSKIKAATLDELTALVVQASKPRPELDDTHCILPGHAPQNGIYVYAKRFSVSNIARKHVNFICESPFMEDTWRPYVQLPYVRVCIGSSCKTETAAVKQIRKLISNVGIEQMARFVEISDRIKDAYVTNRMKEMLSDLDEEWENPWYTANGRFSPDAIKKHYNL